MSDPISSGDESTVDFTKPTHTVTPSDQGLPVPDPSEATTCNFSNEALPAGGVQSGFSGNNSDPSEPRKPTSEGPLKSFGDYELLKKIARGGMGVVYKARQKKLNRQVALKMILAGQLASHEEIQRFYTEAEAAAQLDHPGIVPIFDVGELDGQHYFSMGFVDGGSLAQRIKEKPLPPREAALLVKQVAEAVEYAHGHGIIHRDLKPANILIDRDGNPKITDFGLAKRVSDDSHLTVTGQIMGTPSYMPPEQASGKHAEIGPIADVYSLGAVLFCLLTGRPPFQAANMLDTLKQVLEQEPVSPRELNSAVDRDLETICLKCLQKEPGKRYGTALALAEDLQRFLANEPILARPVGRGERFLRWCRRNPLVASLMTGIALSLVVGTAVAWSFALDAKREAATAREKADEARREKLLGDRRLYVAQINLASRAWQDGQIDLVKRLLEGLIPKEPDDLDLRGFEWHYMQQLCRLDLRTMIGHGKPVCQAIFSPDGKRAASVGQDGLVIIWDATSGKQFLTWKGHAGTVQSAAFDADGRRLVTGGHDNLVKIWDVETGKELAVLRGHQRDVWCVSFSPDRESRWVASASRDQSIKIWNASSGTEAHTLTGHTAMVASLAFDRTGTRLASAGADRTVRVWNVATGKECANLRGHTKMVYGVAFSPDNDHPLVASAGEDMTVRVWDPASGKEVATLRGHRSTLSSVAFSPDGRLLASAGYDQTVRLWKTDTWEESLTLRGHSGWVHSVAFSPDSRRLVSASEDASVKIWDAASPLECLTLRGHSHWVRGLTFSPDGRQVASGSRRFSRSRGRIEGELTLWDAESGRMLHTLEGHTDEVTSVAFSPDGLLLASATAGFATLREGVVDPGAQTKGEIKIWETATRREIHTLQGHTGAVRCLAFSPDGRLASGSDDGTIKIWHPQPGHELATYRGHNKGVQCLAYCREGRLASGGKDKTIRIWDASSASPLLTLESETGVVKSLTLTPDGRFLASACDEAPAISIWDLATGKLDHKLLGHTQTVRCLAVSHDGQRLASAGNDATVKIWDVATGQELFTLAGHRQDVLNVAFSPEGMRLASAGMDGTVKIWDATDTSPEREARREAQSLVRHAFGKPNLRAQVVESIRADNTVSEVVRSEALLLAEHYPENPLGLINACRPVLRNPNAEQYEKVLALSRAESACRFAPEKGSYHITLAAALYRCGHYKAAIETLTQAEPVIRDELGGTMPIQLAVLALSYERLGKHALACQALKNLRETMKLDKFKNDDEASALWREAEQFVKMQAGTQK